MAIIVNGNEIVLTGTVGGYYWLEDGFSAAEVYMALMMIGDDQPVVVRINSGGGAASEGAAIYSFLAAHKGGVDVVIEGWAASAASVLAMAGRTVTMMPGAVMMIHDPRNSVFDADVLDMQRLIDQLNAIADASAEIYALKTKKTAVEMRELMRVETWMTGPQAVEAGFADKIGAANDNPEPVAYAIQSYLRVPDQITSIATARGWKPRESKPAALAAQNSQTQENPMTDKERADALAAELAALKTTSTAEADELAKLRSDKAERERTDAILALPEASGRETVAKALAATAGMTVDSAKAVLAATPKADAVNDDANELERRRLNGAGLSGKPLSTASAGTTVANMQKLLKKGTA